VSGGPLVPLAWSALLAVHTTVLIGFGGDELPVLLLGGAAAAAALFALWLALRRRRGRGATGELRAVPDVSPPAALAAVAVAGLVLGAELGTWLVLISAGLLALALGGLVRELRASPTTVRDTLRRGPG
jgi:hypothetical protein